MLLHLHKNISRKSISLFYNAFSIRRCYQTQQLTPGLYVVATPIGNLQDITLRALDVLDKSQIIACEDTRTTLTLLSKYKIDISNKKLISYVEPSNTQKFSIKNLDTILKFISMGNIVSLVSEAGTPTISDPGAQLVRQVHQEGMRVFTIPGPSSVVAGLAISGLTADKFIFEGFLPKKEKARIETLKELSKLDRTIVFFESPLRVVRTLEDCIKIFGEDRIGCICRELTKHFEEVHVEKLKNLLEIVKSNQKGEFTIIIEGIKQK